MDVRAILDTGFLIALLNGNDRHHAWAIDRLDDLPGPWLTAEACISETVFLLAKAGRPPLKKLFGWIDQRLLIIQHLLPENLAPVTAELFGYRNRWVDFADASIVVLSDKHKKLPVATVDHHDFMVYFRKRRDRKLYTPKMG